MREGEGTAGHYMHGMCEHELALSTLLCITIQKETKTGRGGGGGGSPQSPIGIHTLAPKCACARNSGYVCVFVTSLNGVLQNTPPRLLHPTPTCGQNGLCNFYWWCSSCATYHITEYASTWTHIATCIVMWSPTFPPGHFWKRYVNT